LSQAWHSKPSLVPLHSPDRYWSLPVHSIWLQVLQMVFAPDEQGVLSYELTPQTRHAYWLLSPAGL